VHISRRIILFVEIGAVTLLGVIGTGNCMKKIRKKNPAFLVIGDIILIMIQGIAPATLLRFIRTIIR
jgi:hypothetical protein